MDEIWRTSGKDLFTHINKYQMLADVPGVARRYFQKIELEKKKINFFFVKK